MRKNEEGGLEFSDDELTMLVYHIAARHIEDDYDGPEWENYPNIAEGEWTNVRDRLVDLAAELRQRADNINKGIDARWPLEEAIR